VCSCIFDSCKCGAGFINERSSRDDSHCCGRPSTAVNEDTAEKVKKLVMNERRLSVDFITESVGMPTGMLTENLSMTKVSAGWVPTAEHVIRCSAGARAETSVSLLSLFNENPDNFRLFQVCNCRRDLASSLRPEIT